MSNTWKNPVVVLRSVLIAVCLLLTVSMSLHGHPKLADFVEGMALGLAIGMVALTFSFTPCEWTTTEQDSGIDSLGLQ